MVWVIFMNKHYIVKISAVCVFVHVCLHACVWFYVYVYIHPDTFF